MSEYDLWKQILPSLMVHNNKLNMHPAELRKYYKPFVVNRALSYHKDCVLQANEVNSRYTADLQLQYDYLFHSIRKHRRPFEKYAKRDTAFQEKIGIIKLAYNYSQQKAIEAAKLLTDDQFNILKERYGDLTKTK